MTVPLINSTDNVAAGVVWQLPSNAERMILSEIPLGLQA
jgi:hypothetical protein